ncbi:hypothetical protein ST41_09975 [Prevotella pectinovora]|nr:hypothetical protein ST41_09975 [Prevotella pectinovora]
MGSPLGRLGWVPLWEGQDGFPFGKVRMGSPLGRLGWVPLWEGQDGFPLGKVRMGSPFQKSIGCLTIILECVKFVN